MRGSLLGDFTAGGLAWGITWTLLLSDIALWRGTSTFRKENA